MNALNTTADARLCPRCQRDNRCAVALSQDISQCWCHNADFNPQRISQYRGFERCLCQRCGTELTVQAAVECIDPTEDSHGQ